MVDGITWNPFTQQPLTPEEISALDANKDGILTQEEFDAGYDPSTWLAGGNDVDGGVAVGIEDPLVKAAMQGNMSLTAKDEAEFRKNMAILMDEFLGMYFTKNMGLTDQERTRVQEVVSSSTNKFITEQIADNPKGPYNMIEIAPLYQDFVDGALVKDNESRTAVNASIQGYEDNIDTNYDSMLNYATTNSEDKYLTKQEWNQVRNAAVRYMMGLLLSGTENNELLSAINKNYSKNSYYTQAVNLANQLKSCQDPEKMKQLMAQMQTALANFLEQAGASKVTDAIKSVEENKQKTTISDALAKPADSFVESKIKAGMTDEEKAAIKSFVDSQLNTFIENLIKEGNFDYTKINTYVTKFKNDLEKNYIKFQNAQKEVDKMAAGVEVTQDAFIRIVDSVKANGNISAEEKDKIVSAASDLVLKQLLSGMSDIPFLSMLSSSYKSSPEYVELTGVIAQMRSATSVEDVNKLKVEALALLNKMIDKYSIDKITTAVDYLRPANVDDDMKYDAIKASGLEADYDAGTTRTTGYCDFNEDNCSIDDQPQNVKDEYNKLVEMAKQDMRNYAESLKAELKAELGAAYDEASIEQIINSAINDTIIAFTLSGEGKGKLYQDDRVDGGNYQVMKENEIGFVFLERSHSKGRFGYSVTALIDTFTKYFNEAAKTYKAEQADPSTITYDREDVIADSIGTIDYGSDYMSWDTDKARAQAKAKLRAMSSSILAQLSAKGCKIPLTVVEELLEDSIDETVGLVLIGYSTERLVNSFFDTFDAKLAKAKEEYN